MLNIRLLYILLDARSIRTYLGLAAGIGVGVLADVVIILKLSLLVGPWVTMAILAANAALGIRIAYSLVDRRAKAIIATVDRGRCDHEEFFRYIATLIASLFLIVPGLVNTLIGAVLLIPGVSALAGARVSGMLGIDWREAYEYLRLERIAGGTKA